MNGQRPALRHKMLSWQKDPREYSAALLVLCCVCVSLFFLIKEQNVICIYLSGRDFVIYFYMYVIRGKEFRINHRIKLAFDLKRDTMSIFALRRN